jgi:hypothetical protein
MVKVKPTAVPPGGITHNTITRVRGVLTEAEKEAVKRDTFKHIPTIKKNIERMEQDLNEGNYEKSYAPEVEKALAKEKYKLNHIEEEIKIKIDIQKDIAQVIGEYENGLVNENETAERLRLFPLIIDIPDRDRPELARKYQVASGVYAEEEFNNKLSTIFESDRWSFRKQTDEEINDYEITDKQDEYYPFYLELKARKDAIPYTWKPGKTPTEEQSIEYTINLISAPYKKYNTGSGLWCPLKKIEFFDSVGGNNCFYINKIEKDGIPTYAIYHYDAEEVKNFNQTTWFGKKQIDIPWNEFEYISIDDFNGKKGYNFLTKESDTNSNV